MLMNHHPDCDCFDCDVRFDRHIDTNKVGRIFGQKPNTIEKGRVQGSPIPYIKIGRSVRYRARDVRAFLETCRVTSTSCSPKSASSTSTGEKAI